MSKPQDFTPDFSLLLDLFDQADIAFHFSDRQGRCLYINEVGLKVVGASSASEVLGLTPIEYGPRCGWSQDFCDKALKRELDCMESGQVNYPLQVALPKEGLTYDQTITLVPRYNEKKKVIGLFTICLKVDSRKIKEEIMRKWKDLA